MDKIDLKEKRQSLDILWFDVFELCRETVSSAKRDGTVLKASYLKELTSYLRELELVLDRLKQDQGEDNEGLEEVAEILEGIDFDEMGLSSGKESLEDTKTDMNKPLEIG